MLKNRFHSRKNKKTSRRRLLVLASVLFVILCTAGALFVWQKNKSDNNQNTNGQSNSDIRPQNTVDYSPAEESDNKDVEDAKSNPSKVPTTIDNQTSNPSGQVEFSVTVTGANPDNTNKLVRVSSLVNGVTSGTCVVTFNKAGQSKVTATNQVELQNNSYVCPNFSIPFSQFPAGGEWDVSLAVTNNGKTVNAPWQGGSVTINK